MANPEHLGKLKKGVEVWNAWRQANPEMRPDLKNADLKAVELYSRVGPSSIVPVNLEGAQLKEANLEKAELPHANLKGADLTKANLTWCNLTGASLEAANLTEAILEHAILFDVNLERAKMQRVLCSEIILQGANLKQVNMIEAWGDEVNLSQANLKYANLSGALLLKAKVNNSNLEKSNLVHVDLRESKLVKAKLKGANLHMARLQDADLNEADLVQANLNHAQLDGALLERVNLRKADLRGANLNGANVTAVRFDRWARYRGIRVDNCYGSPRFRRFSQDQDLIEELRERSTWGRLLYCLWLVFADCGRSFWPVFVWSFLVCIVFGAIYAEYSIPPWLSWLPQSIRNLLFDINPQLNMLYSNTTFTPYYFSIVAFTTLGFGDVVPLNRAGEIWITIEVIIGYLMLGLLISILANKLARRS